MVREIHAIMQDSQDLDILPRIPAEEDHVAIAGMAKKVIADFRTGSPPDLTCSELVEDGGQLPAFCLLPCGFDRIAQAPQSGLPGFLGGDLQAQRASRTTSDASL